MRGGRGDKREVCNHHTHVDTSTKENIGTYLQIQDKTVFCIIFEDTGTSIIWEPELTVDSVFAFIGLLIVLLPMVLYDYFRRRTDTSMSGFTRFY